MPEYVAKIKGTYEERNGPSLLKMIFGFRGKRINFNEERRFSACDDLVAYEKAKEQKELIDRNLIRPITKLDSLIKIKHVDLSSYA